MTNRPFLVTILFLFLWVPVCFGQEAGDPIERFLTELEARGTKGDLVRMVARDLRVEENERRFRKKVESKVSDAKAREAIFRTLRTAKRAHAGQTQTRSGHVAGMERIPYVNHSIRVAEYALDLGLSSKAVQAALLHDVLEDTAVGRKQLRRTVSPEVMTMVEDLTWRPEETRRAFNERVRGLKGESRALKGLDRMHNLIRAYTIQDAAYHARYLEEARRVYRPLFEDPRLRSMASTFDRLANGVEQYRRTLVGEAETKPVARDGLFSFRRADGSVDWNAVRKNPAVRFAGGAGHFAFSLFLKELAVVARTGNTDRISEFFDHLLTTDFFVEYGLFSAGAELGRIGYGRFLQHRIRPAFVSGVLKSSVALGVGLALPDLVRGRFDGRVFFIRLTSLGLSTAAVRGAVTGIRWVSNLASGGRLARWGRRVLAAKKLAAVGGWVYTAAETAVILTIGEKIEKWALKKLAEHDARKKREAGEEALKRLLAAPEEMGPKRLQEALNELARGADAWRRYLARPLMGAEAELRERLNDLGKRALLLRDKQEAMRRHLKTQPALVALLSRRYNSLDGYLQYKLADEIEDLDADLDRAARLYEADRREAFEAMEKRGDRDRTYAHQLRLLNGARRAVDDPGLRQLIDAEIGIVKRQRKLDRNLFSPPRKETSGIVDALGR